MRFLLVDGNNIAYRNFASMRLSDSIGRPTGAVYGFLTSLKRAAESRPSRIVVCWDHGGSRWRTALYPAYKRHRKRMKRRAHRDYTRQLRSLEKALRHLYVAQARIKGVEADDLIGILTGALTRRGHTVSILSADQDFYQLLGGRVTVLKPSGEALTAAWLRREHGVGPLQWPDVRALMGDPSDNIPGVRGIGRKRAVALVSELGCLEEIAMGTPVPGPLARHVSVVREAIDEAMLYRRLIRLPDRPSSELYDGTRLAAVREAVLGVVSGRAFGPGVDRRGFIGFCVEHELQRFLRERDSWWRAFERRRRKS